MKKIKEHISGFLNIILSFSPWIVYSLLTGRTLIRQEIAIGVAILLTVTCCLNNLRKGFILDWGTLLFYTGLAFGTYFFRDAWAIKHASMTSNIAISLKGEV